MIDIKRDLVYALNLLPSTEMLSTGEAFWDIPATTELSEKGLIFHQLPGVDTGAPCNVEVCSYLLIMNKSGYEKVIGTIC